MIRRASQVLKLLGFIVISGAAIWALSWLLQYLCARTIRGSVFHLSAKPTNLLAAATVLGVVCVVSLMFVLTENKGCQKWLWVLAWWAFVFPMLISLANHAFKDTAVSSAGAQAIYIVVTILASFLVWYVAMGDDLEELID